MIVKHNSKKDIMAKKMFDDHDLDQAVIEKLANDANYEAKMIAQFNAKVNKVEPQNKPDVKISGNSEQGGPSGLEPTRYGDWESKGRCYDF